MSADGNTAIVAGPGDNGLTGAAWIWIRGGGVWTQQGNKLIGLGAVGNATQGNSVSLSADGNTAVVGGPSDDGGNGAAWIWTRNAGIWNQLGSKLVGLGAVPGDGFNPSQGVSVAFSADGKTVLVGGYHDEGGFPGASWVFVPAPDLDITKSAIGGPVFLAGGDINYTTSVVNNGPGNANDVVVTDVLPVGTTFVSSTPSQGSCSGTSTVSCTLGALANGGSATISLVIKTASTPGPVSNTATVVAAEVDLNPANNSSTSTINTVDPTSVPAASVWLLIALAGMLAQLGGMRIR
ncbi:MAG TPA: DUF11 domain-containing protein [Thermoanaerobaculia bacterium]|nr:DUF11 domain-containing protein [Thermoanaerobaculia bacterium]